MNFEHDHRSMVHHQSTKVVIVALKNMPRIKEKTSVEFQSIDTLFETPMYADHASIINEVKITKIV